MSKAILVIDMPDSCWGCSLVVQKENGCRVCVATNCTLISREGKFSWCPLISAPDVSAKPIGAYVDTRTQITN